MFGIDAFAGSLANYSGAINLVSTAFNVFGGLKRSREESELYAAQAVQAADQARVEREVGEVRATRTRKVGERDIGTARSGYAAAGVDVSSGSAAIVAGELSSRIELDALTEILTGNRRGAALEATAADRRRASDNARQSGLWAAGGSVLSGFARQSEISRWNSRASNSLGTRGPIGGSASDPWYG